MTPTRRYCRRYPGSRCTSLQTTDKGAQHATNSPAQTTPDAAQEHNRPSTNHAETILRTATAQCQSQSTKRAAIERTNPTKQLGPNRHTQKSSTDNTRPAAEAPEVQKDLKRIKKVQAGSSIEAKRENAVDNHPARVRDSRGAPVHHRHQGKPRGQNEYGRPLHQIANNGHRRIHHQPTPPANTDAARHAHMRRPPATTTLKAQQPDEKIPPTLNCEDGDAVTSNKPATTTTKKIQISAHNLKSQQAKRRANVPTSDGIRAGTAFIAELCPRFNGTLV